jgi:N-acetylmuramoyl-L-alanine amidase
VCRVDGVPRPLDKADQRSALRTSALYNNRVSRIVCATLAAAVAVGLTAGLAGQAPPAVPLRVVSVEGSRTVPTVMAGDTELVAMADLTAIFGVEVREDTAARAITVTYRGSTIVISQGQALASISGRLVSLPAPPSRINNRWYVPVEFIGRALAAIYDVPLELRKASRLVLRGRIRAPRVIVRHDVAGGQARVTLDISPATPHQVAQEGPRILVRFEADLLDATIPPVQSQGFIQRIAVEGMAIAIDTGPRFASLRAADATGGADTTRLVLDLFGAPEPAAPGPEPAAPGTPEAPPPLPTSNVRTIVIDPGHGGTEDGARGSKGTLEKAVTLAVARRLKTALETRLGARVLLTRDDDRVVALDERAAFANNNKADLFISLHANASLRRTAAGAEVFYLTLDRADEEARRVAESEGVAMPVFGGGTREIDVILWEMAQVQHLTRSAAFAQLVEARLRGAVPVSPRAIQQAPFRVLVGANMPAVLVEVGYISNPEQESAMAAAPFQSRLAQALTDAVAAFFSQDAPAASAPAAGTGAGDRR